MNPTAWFETFRKGKEYELLKTKPLAYFSIEYALSDKLPTYAGGLGILAGDYIKELADQQIPSVAVGMYYQNRYGFDSHAVEQREHTILTPEHQDLTPVMDSEGKQLMVSVPMQDRDVFVKVWLWQQQSIPVYLLDTNVAENTPEDQRICYELYNADKEYRLKQEMILGIGGFRVLEALHISPSIYHMNEGHSALLALEIVRHEMQKRQISFHDAVGLASHHIVFTNHTLVPAGNDMFGTQLMMVSLQRYAEELEVPVQDLVALGTITDTHDFSMAMLAMRLAGRINGVSVLHAKVAQTVWPEFKLQPVTNGIHIPSWEFTQSHSEGKKQLLAYIKEQTGQDWDENVLLLGWARRMVLYKRPLALFGDIKQFVQMANDANRPVRVVLAGIAHRADDEGKGLTLRLQELVHNELEGLVVYLPGYSKTLSRRMLSGCDVWLNTPVVGSEACGTSGMKASLNGILPVSTKDGWMAEVDIPSMGWEIESDMVQSSLIATLQDKVIPTYYQEGKEAWQRLQDQGRKVVKEQFSTTRMLKDYFEKTYLPILTVSYEHY